MVVLHIEVDDEGKKYTVSADQGVSVSEICFGISAMIKCLKREGIIDDNVVIYNMIQKYTEDTSMDLPVEEAEAEQLTLEVPVDENPS